MKKIVVHDFWYDLLTVTSIYTFIHGMVIIPYVKAISKKFGCIANHFSVRTIDENWKVIETQWMKQCVCVQYTM
jgi:hypothetical protein